MEFLDDHIKTTPGLVLFVDVDGGEGEVKVFTHEAGFPKDFDLKLTIAIYKKTNFYSVSTW